MPIQPDLLKKHSSEQSNLPTLYHIHLYPTRCTRAHASPLLSESCRTHDRLPLSLTSLSLVAVSTFSSCLVPRLASLAIAGLSVALGLALSGHTIRVLEKSPRLGSRAYPGGIRLTPNVSKILVQWGLADEIRKRGSLAREGSHLWDCRFASFC
jgi:hypothetical protein